MSPPLPVSLVPPRPNPGPEPWRDDLPAWLFLTPLALALAAALVFAWGGRRRRRTALSSSPMLSAGDSPEARLLALGEGVRDLLARRLGPGLRARTTEELLDDPQVADLLGGDRDRLAAILGAGDRIKFARQAGSEGFAERLDEWTTWAGMLEATLRRS